MQPMMDTPQTIRMPSRITMRSGFHVQGMTFHVEAGRQKTLLSVGAQAGIPAQLRMAGDPQDLLRRENMPAVRAGHPPTQRK